MMEKIKLLNKIYTKQKKAGEAIIMIDTEDLRAKDVAKVGSFNNDKEISPLKLPGEIDKSQLQWKI